MNKLQAIALAGIALVASAGAASADTYVENATSVRKSTVVTLKPTPTSLDTK